MSTDKPQQTRITSADGTSLRILTWSEREEPRARVLFIHGWAEHSERYGLPAAFLVERGYDCYAADVRGHGHSGGRRGYIDRYDDYLDDVHAVVQWLAPRNKAPLVIVGHSQGGLVVTRYIQSRPSTEDIAAFVLSCPFFGMAIAVPSIKRVAGNIMSALVPAFALDAGLDTSGLSKDEAMVRAYEEDPLIFSKACSRWFTETTTAQDQVMAEASRVRLPVLIMHGADDPIANPATTSAFHDRCDSADKTLTLYDGLRHEIFNEVERETVYADVAAWLDERF